ncbi:Nuclear factor NF-kappa-B subunit [Aphelenchoides bicaudatus]|nr:Nuclear factor NF-kappa-B subunit [Aphelenchoides bicaudatus]
MSSNDKATADSSCLVARAAPCALPAAPVEPKLNDLTKDEKKSNDTDSLINNFTKLSVNATTIKKPVKVADPADFVTLQSLRSSALARKTNTTSKFGRDGANLFADLLATDEDEKPAQPFAEKKAEEKEAKPKEETKGDETPKVEKPEFKEEKENKEGDEKDESDLLSRGPVRVARSNVAYHPYSGTNPYPASNESFDQSCAAFSHPSDVYYGQWTTNREILSSSSTPDTVSTDYGYSSSTTSPHQQQSTSNYMIGNCVPSTVLPGKDDAELPDALSDFILKYSRSYRGPHHENADEASSGMISPKKRPASVDSNLCESPLSAGSAPEGSSPAAPFGGITGPSTPLSDYRGYNKMGPLKNQLPSGQYTAYLGRHGGHSPEQHPRPAKEVMRKLISAEEMDDAWAWISKCLKNYAGALCYQDSDYDSLLHIVASHLDLGKIFALVEQMIKTEYPGHKKPFDMKNRNNETPLFLAVEKRNNAVVDYLLEAGADPNTQNCKVDRDSPLHLAARLGMAEIVKTICSYSSTNLNATNGKGLTPLLCAVMNHGVYEEENGGYIVDNTQTIHYLLKFGADPLITDATNGRNAMHFAITRMAPEIIDAFKDNLDEEIMSALVNKPDNNGETALSQLQSLVNTDESIRFKLGMSLIMYGANNSATPSP